MSIVRCLLIFMALALLTASAAAETATRAPDTAPPSVPEPSAPPATTPIAPRARRTDASELALELNVPLNSRSLSFGVRYGSSVRWKRRGHPAIGLGGSASLSTDFLLRGLNGGFLVDDLYSPGIGLGLRGGLVVQPRRLKKPMLPQPQSWMVGIGLRGVAELDDLLEPGGGLELDTYVRGDVAMFLGILFRYAGFTFTVRPYGGGVHWEPEMTRLIEPRLGNMLLEIDVGIPLYTLFRRETTR